MGFYIRKGFNFDPLRLNLSRSGLGASFGVRGARIGIGPRGSYVHLGRGGFYYRQSLGSGSSPVTPAYTPILSAADEGLQEISSAAATTIVDASSTELLQELNRVKRRYDIFPIVLTVGCVLLVALIASGFDWWVYVAGGIAIVGLAAGARHDDVTHTTALNYSLSGETETAFSKLQTALRNLESSQKLWHLDAAGAASDWKRNAGASWLFRKSDAQSLLSLPAKTVCNLNVPTLRSKRKAFYFFPDRLLVYDSTGIGAVPYSAMRATALQTQFIEAGDVPTNSPVIGGRLSWLLLLRVREYYTGGFWAISPVPSGHVSA
jgi:Protein of unknown function (DUF4236)